MTAPVALWIDPFSHHFEHDRLFRESDGTPHADDYAAPWRHLRDWFRARGVEVHTADLLVNGHASPASLNLYVSLGLRTRYRRLLRRPDVVPSAFFAFECPIVEPRLYRDLEDVAAVFRRVYSFSTPDALAPFIDAPLELREFRLPQAYDRVHEDVWRRRERRFLMMLNTNKVPRLSDNELYSERLRALAFFHRHAEIDLYGVGWSGPPFRTGATRVPSVARKAGHWLRAVADRMVGPRDPLLVAARAAYRGSVAAKAEALGGYTFAVCFENMILDGWVTEKLFDCLLAGTVPIYLGAPDIEGWVPPECFVDMRRFADYAELRTFLHGLSPHEIDGYREAGRDYIESERFRPFSKAALVELFASLVESDAEVRL